MTFTDQDFTEATPSTDALTFSDADFEPKTNDPTPPAPQPYQFSTPPDAPATPAPTTTSTAVGSLAGSAVRNIAPVRAGMLAARPGAMAGAAIGAMVPGADLTGIPELIGGIIGGLVGFGAGMWGASKAQTKIADVIAPESVFGSKMEEQQATEHPWASEIGGLLAFGKPNPKAVINAGKTVATTEGRAALTDLAKSVTQKDGLAAWKEATDPTMQKNVFNVLNVAQMGGGNAMFNLADQIQSGHYSVAQLAKSAAEGALFNEPWFNKPHPATAQFDKTKGDPNASDITSSTEVPVRNEGSGLDESSPLRQQGEAAPARQAQEEIQTPPVAQTLTREQKVAIKALQARGVEPEAARAVLYASGGKSIDETDEQFRARLFQLHDQLGLKVKKEAAQFQSEDVLRQQMQKDGWSPQQQEAGIADARRKNQAQLDDIDAANQNILGQIASGKPTKLAVAPVKFSQLQQTRPDIGWYEVTAPFAAPDGSTYQPGKFVTNGQLERWGMKIPDNEQARFSVAQLAAPKPPSEPAKPPMAKVPVAPTPSPAPVGAAASPPQLAKPTLTSEQHWLFDSKAGDVQTTPNGGNVIVIKHFDKLKDANELSAALFNATSGKVNAKVEPWIKKPSKPGAKGVNQYTVYARNVSDAVAQSIRDAQAPVKENAPISDSVKSEATLPNPKSVPESLPVVAQEPISAAVLTKTSRLTGNSHDEIYAKYPNAKGGTEGFILPSGEFIPRKEAAKRFNGRQHSHEFDFGKPLGELYAQAKEAGYASERSFETDHAKNADHEVKESKSEFLKRRYCSETIPKRRSVLSE